MLSNSTHRENSAKLQRRNDGRCRALPMFSRICRVSWAFCPSAAQPTMRLHQGRRRSGAAGQRQTKQRSEPPEAIVASAPSTVALAPKFVTSRLNLIEHRLERLEVCFRDGERLFQRAFIHCQGLCGRTVGTFPGGKQRNSSELSMARTPRSVFPADMRPDLTARQIEDLEVPAASAASRKLKAVMTVRSRKLIPERLRRRWLRER